MKILVVDDNIEIVRLLTTRFELEGPDFEVSAITEDFEAGVRAAAAGGVDVVVLDLWLQHEDFAEGYPLAHRLFDLIREGNPLAKVIIYSAVVGLQHDSEIELIADVVLHKPDMEKLVSMARQLGAS